MFYSRENKTANGDKEEEKIKKILGRERVAVRVQRKHSKKVLQWESRLGISKEIIGAE